MWPFVGKTESGFVSKFGHLLGLHDIPAPQRLELLPYSVARGTFQTPQNPRDPYDRALSDSSRGRAFAAHGASVT